MPRTKYLRRDSRVDENQTEIVDAMRGIGALVFDIHMLAGGIPDLLVAFRGKLMLMEVKTTNGKLTPKERETIRQITMQGVPVYIVRSWEKAIEICMQE